MDIDIFRTSDEEERKKMRKLLLGRQISFSEKWEKIPLLKRQKSGGKKEICVIYISDYYDHLIEEIKREMNLKEEL